MNPHRLTWGLAFEFSFVKIMAFVTLLGFIIMVMRSRQMPRLPRQRETTLLFLLWAMLTITTVFALRPEWAWQEWQLVSKILILTFLTIYLVDTEQKLRIYLLVVAFSIGYYGFKGGLFSILTGGNYLVFGPEHSFIADNTALGLGLNMVIPLLFYLAVDEERIWLKWLLQVTFLLSALAVVFTYSRGALLGLFVVLALIFFHLGPIKKTVLVVIAVLALPIAVSQIPDRWFDKMETLETYEENESAMSRIAAWKAAWKLALDRPLVGGGFQITRDTHWMFETYNPDAIDDGYETGVHSSYFEVMAENGLVTFFIWAALGISCWLSSIRIRRLARRYGFKEYQSYGYMIEGSLFAFGVSAAFLEFAMFDLLYSVVAIVIVTKTLLDEKINQFESSIETASRSDWRLRNIAASPGGAVSSRGEV